MIETIPSEPVLHSLRDEIRRVTRTLLAMGEVGALSLPALQLAITSYAENVHDVTISPFGVLPFAAPGIAESHAIASVLFLSAPLVGAYVIGGRWGIFPRHDSGAREPQVNQ